MILRIERSDRGQQLVLSLVALGELVRRWVQRDDALIQWFSGVADRGTDPILRFIGNDAQQPWAERGIGAKGGQRLDCLDEGSLRGVLRFVGVAGNHAGHAEGNVLVPPHELREGDLISVFCSSN